ncbi:MAG: helix-turn-helix domain-containing protein [Candidatus Nitrosocosmicus sp.]
MTLTRESFEKFYRHEQDIKTKERMLLVFNVVYHGMIAAKVARDLHRSKAWACEWLKRYYKEGIDGLIDLKAADLQNYLKRSVTRLRKN